MNQDSYFLDVESSVSGRSWRDRLSDQRTAQTISQMYELPDILGRVLAARGVAAENVGPFMAPTLRDLMPAAAAIRDLDAGAERIVAAVRGGERIGIIGDYDVDGICSSALMTRFFRHLGNEPLVHIPHRLDEGYGPNVATLDRFKAEGINLAITVDCGIGAHEPMSHAETLGMDVLIVDHHQAGQHLPQANAVINPNRLDDLSGQGQLCAAGVSFVLLATVHAQLKRSGYYQSAGLEDADLLEWLDLVALATICDVVPLTGLNRALVTQGFKVMSRRGNTGLAALSDAAGLKRRPDTHAAGFVLGPRINAAGRLGFSELALELLTTSDRARASRIGQELEVLNKQRQAIELSVFEQAMAQGEDAVGNSERCAGAHCYRR